MAAAFGTGYGHLSRIVVRSGQSVRKGQVIGAVGNTGLSTGPHLHYELYKNGVAVNPRSVAFSSMRQLTGSDLGAFRSKLASSCRCRWGAARRRTRIEIRLSVRRLSRDRRPSAPSDADSGTFKGTNRDQC